MSLWKKVIETVEARRRHGDFENAILQAAFLFEKAAADPAPDATLEMSDSRGWTKEVAAEPVDLLARDQLVASLQEFATDRPDDPGIGGVFWALGKVGDAKLAPFLQTALTHQMYRLALARRET